MLIYVDDIFLTRTNSTAISSLISHLQIEFPLKDLGSLSFFLGIQATHTSSGLHLCQAKYILDLLHRANMLGAKPSKSPCPLGSKLSKFDGSTLLDLIEYRHVVGALQYYTLTHLELAFSVNQFCQHMHAPTSTHWIAMKRVLHYLKNSVDHGLIYTKGHIHLSAYCDSDWAGNLDDCQSTFRFAIFLGNCLISKSAKK
jgi:hypothetical protein